jgi:hypothetical protein
VPLNTDGSAQGDVCAKPKVLILATQQLIIGKKDTSGRAACAPSKHFEDCRDIAVLKFSGSDSAPIETIARGGISHQLIAAI